MKLISLASAAVTIVMSLNNLYAQGHFFIADPVLSPDATTIYFSYEGDLWKMPASGGNAFRITSMEGEETRPAVSPDGEWLAFTSNQYGSEDIYIISTGGGEVKQLTFHESFDHVDAWSWDSNTIYFTSNRYNRFSGYAVSKDGGTPKRIFGHYFNTVHNVFPHPSSGEIFFNESWESKNFAHRKRYKGDYNPDVKSYNPETGEYREYTDYNGKDFGVTIDRQGNIYFKSDEANGEYNLYTFEGTTKKQLTDFTSSIMWPKVSANGQKIVFTIDYQLHVYDVASGETTRPNVSLYSNYTLDRMQDFQVSGNITYFDVSPDNKKLAFVSRGRLFVSDTKGKFIRPVETQSNEAVKEVHWAADSKTLLFSQSVRGYYNWFTVVANGSVTPTKRTNDQQNNRQLTFNSDRTKAVYLSGRNEVRIMDLDNFTSTTIAEDELWGFYNSSPVFSPDDKYIAFTAYRAFEEEVMIYNTASKNITNLAHSKVSESTPVWSPDGRYIYITADLLNPSYPYGADNINIYRIPLTKLEDEFAVDRAQKLFEEESEEEGRKKKKREGEEETEEKDQVSVTIDFTEIMDRLEVVGPVFGSQQNPYVAQKDEKTYVLYTSNHDEGKSGLWKTVYEPFESIKTEKVGDGIGSYLLKEADGNYYLWANGHIHTLNGDFSKLEKIDMSYTFRKNLENEFEQMFYEAWAGMEQNFYDETFHGEDWAALRDKYAAFIPHVTSRSDLRRILNDMLGELNTSHFGFSSGGDEEDVFHSTRTLATGLLFEEDDPYLVQAVVKDGPADITGKDIRIGDRLVAVNGKRVQPDTNREYYFMQPSSDSEIALTLSREGKEHTVNIHTTSYRNISDLLYDQWQDSNQRYVDEKSNNRIAYIHMKNMGRGEFNIFKRDIVSEGAYRDALILDLRYNTGGNVHDDVLRLLSQRTYLQWKYREGELGNQSNFAPADKPIVLLINEQSLSDAEMTSAGFKALGLGTIVGTETYRWIIFTSGAQLVDGSFYRLPSWGCYTLEGEDLEVTGVSPDVYVAEDFDDRLNDRQLQLDKAIEIILEQLD